MATPESRYLAILQLPISQQDTSSFLGAFSTLHHGSVLTLTLR